MCRGHRNLLPSNSALTLMSRSHFHLSRSSDSPTTNISMGNTLLTIDRPKGIISIDPPGYSGGTLFMLSLAGCFSGDMFGEAKNRNIPLKRVDVDVEVDWGPKDECAESIHVSTEVEADASEKDILDLIQWADSDSTIFRTVRTGIPFTLSPIKVVSRLPKAVAR